MARSGVLPVGALGEWGSGGCPCGPRPGGERAGWVQPGPPDRGRREGKGEWGGPGGQPHRPPPGPDFTRRELLPCVK